MRTGAPSRRDREAQLRARRVSSAHVVAAVADGRGGRGGEGLQVGGAVDAQVGGERARRPVVGEVGEQAVGAGVGELHAGRPGAVGGPGSGWRCWKPVRSRRATIRCMRLLVLDVEVADGVARRSSSDAEAQRLGTAAAQLGLRRRRGAGRRRRRRGRARGRARQRPCSRPPPRRRESAPRGSIARPASARRAQNATTSSRRRRAMRVTGDIRARGMLRDAGYQIPPGG